MTNIKFPRDRELRERERKRGREEINSIAITRIKFSRPLRSRLFRARSKKRERDAASQDTIRPVFSIIFLRSDIYLCNNSPSSFETPRSIKFSRTDDALLRSPDFALLSLSVSRTSHRDGFRIHNYIQPRFFFSSLRVVVPFEFLPLPSFSPANSSLRIRAHRCRASFSCRPPLPPPRFRYFSSSSTGFN